MEIAFLFDDSHSMGGQPYRAVKKWMKKLIDIYNIDGNKRKAAIMQWSDKIRTTITFEERLTKDELKEEIDAIKHKGGHTKGGHALNTAFRKFFHRHGKPNVWQAVIFLSDGNNKDEDVDLGDAAKKFHRENIRITAVYLGENIRDRQEMERMLGENLPYQNKFFQAENLPKLTSNQFVHEVSRCPVGL